MKTKKTKHFPQCEIEVLILEVDTVWTLQTTLPQKVGPLPKLKRSGPTSNQKKHPKKARILTKAGLFLDEKLSGIIRESLLSGEVTEAKGDTVKP